MLILIQRDDCSLCDAAWDVLHEAGVRDFEAQFIEGHAELEQRYGTRVPVLQAGSDELAWPFDAKAVMAWLAALR
jgi:Glutaredoxin-like domain (DUF836)